ncbi:MAG: isoprenyl transferase [Deltaproteobacteria bacterium]|nr:isoprenyl transferase [Deltaproteobacteria bacterium]
MSSELSDTLPSPLIPERLPVHVAIIMDGNGRWAKKRFLNRIKGHEKGADTVRTIVRTARRFGIQVLTLYAFSTENWSRPKVEVKALMTLLERFLRSEADEMIQTDIRLNATGQVERLPNGVRRTLESVIHATRTNGSMVLNLALSYGGRAEIVRMVRQLAQKANAGLILPEAIDEQTVADHLYTRDLPDPDLLIRTSGEMRISNFLLWQIAYSEIFITKTLWPDFGEDEFLSILQDYQQRERRFGKVDEMQQ